MSAVEVLGWLKIQGIEVTRRGENLGVTSERGELTAEQRAWIVENKADLLAHFRAVEDCSPLRELKTPSVPGEGGEKDSAIYREYPLPDGDVLQVTREEFDNVVELYRLLWRLDQKLSQRRKAA